MSSAFAAASSFIRKMVSVFLNSNTSKLLTPATATSATPAAPTSGGLSVVPISPLPPKEVRVDVPVFEVPFGGGVEGVDYIPVRAPTRVRHRVSSEFGWRTDPISHEKKLHKGVDLATEVGTDLESPDPGRVLTAQFKEDGAGRRVVVEHLAKMTGRAYTYCTAYFHLSEILVQPDQIVSRGTLVGKSGGDPKDPQAGRTTAPHTHFETRTPPSLGYKPVRPVLIWSDVG